jgi:5-hydroxyisourate hydrolase
MSGISTHVLDTSTGMPARGIKVQLVLAGAVLGSGVTGQDGRIPALLPDGIALRPGRYRILFEIGDYFPSGFYPEVSIDFSALDGAAHYHIPLLISPFGYTTYRGS